jgi:hypothetical protein
MESALAAYALPFAGRSAVTHLLGVVVWRNFTLISASTWVFLAVATARGLVRASSGASKLATIGLRELSTYFDIRRVTTECTTGFLGGTAPGPLVLIAAVYTDASGKLCTFVSIGWVFAEVFAGFIGATTQNLPRLF